MIKHTLVRRSLLRGFAVAAAASALVIAAKPSAGYSAPQGGAVIQVRDFPAASIVEIVAWNAAEPQFGLRTFVKRNGAADRYHRLWVNGAYPAIGDAATAQGLNRPLQVSSAKENIEVKFITNSGAEIVFTARRPLLDAYLAAVDSVVAALKK